MDLMFDDIPDSSGSVPPFDAIPAAAPKQQQALPSFDEMPTAVAPAPLQFDSIPAPQTQVSGNIPNPPAPPSPEKTNTEVPGFWRTVGSAFGHGVVQRTMDDIAGGKVALPPGMGGLTLEQQYQAGLVDPPTKTEIDDLLQKKVNEGWTDPKWWGAQIAHGAGGMVPAAGAATVGALARVPVPLTFGVEGGLGTLVPAYKRAREAGLDPEAATTRALIDSGIAAGVATAMGIAPGLSLFGRNAATSAETVAGALKRPVMEMLAQLGLVQPSLAVTGEIVRDLSHGEAPDPWGLATTYVVGAAQGVPIVGAHSAMPAVRAIRSRAVPAEPPATPEQVQSSFQNQQHGVVIPEATGTRPAAPDQPFIAYEEPVQAKEDRVFFSPVRETIEAKMPENAPAHQVLGILRGGSGVKQEEILDLGLPAYLADHKGNVNKNDLLAYVDSESVRLEEIQRGTGPNDLPVEYERQILPGEHTNYREFVLKTPTPKVDPAVVEQKAREAWRFNNEKTMGPWEQAGEHTRQLMLRQAEQFIHQANPDAYTGGHFPEVNSIAHFRTTDRLGRNGERLLHIEESQSDLHQTAAKMGMRERGEKAIDFNAIDRERTLLTREENQLHREGRPIDDPRIREIQTRLRELNNLYDAGLKQAPFAHFPFKTSWQELVIKRALRLAADEGYDGVSIANGHQVMLRVLDPEKRRGVEENYDKKNRSILVKWAKKMGMDVGETKFEGAGPQEWLASIPMESRRFAVEQRIQQLGLDRNFNDRNTMVLLNPAAGSRIRQGLPLYETGPEAAGGGVTLNQAVQKGNPKEMAKFAQQIVQVIGGIGKDIKITRPIRFEIKPNRATWRGQAEPVNGEYVIRINTRLLSRVEDMYATAVHELGHVVMWDKFARAPMELQLKISEAFKQFRLKLSEEARTVGDLRRIRDNPISEMTGARNLNTAGRWSDTIPLSDLTPKSRAYLMHFEEWFAEQVAKWGSTSEKPLGRVEKFFKSLGDTVRKLVTQFRGQRKTSPEAVPEMQQWLDSLYHDGKAVADMLDQLELDSKRRNADALDRDGTPEVVATPQTNSTGGGRDIIGNLPPGSVPSGPATAAHADRFNRFYEWMTSLPQIAELNKHIRPLQMYKEIVAIMNVEKNNIMGAAEETLRQWKKIRDPQQQVALGKFIEDYMNGFFKKVDDGLIRRPTQAEFVDLAAKHKLSAESLRMFDRIVRDFDGFLERYRELLLADAFRIKDPISKLDAVRRINERVDALLQRPFMPAMRWGKYTVTVYDANDNVRHFEQVETLRRRQQVIDALKKSPDLLPGDKVLPGEVPKDATPLLGMPPGLLELVADKLNLSDTQRSMLDQLRFDYAPSQSFKHQFRQKDLTPGYSTDFQRAYASFFFHGANHFTRVKWVDALRDQQREVRSSKLTLTESEAQKNKRDAIANYMGEHLTMLVDPKPDFAALRALMFHWYLGFNPASATLNLSQTPLMTFPHLASKFGGLGLGDLRAAQAILKASSDLNNFYRKGTLIDQGKNAPPGPKGAALRALGEAVKEGVISETQAHTLAAVSEGRNLARAFGSKVEQGWHQFSEASSWMFEMAEQYNRRVAFRAAWELAFRDPSNKYVQEAVRDNRLQYERLMNGSGGARWSHQEAAAFVAAKDSVEKSQFVYAPYSRSKFMWGKKGSLFIFKNFVQNTLFNLWSNPAMAARHLLILGAMGGLMGLPGAEDINGILKALGWHLFGKDFDVEDQARKFAVDVLNGTVSPDMLLHGTSVKGFGIPHVVNALGGSVGLPKVFPTTDRHSAVGMGNILPIEPGKLFGPTKDVKTSGFDQLQRASGAGFSNIFAMYQFLNSQDSRADLKKWELIMPRAASNISHAFRYLYQGEERNRAGNAVVRFDANDTEHMAEIFARLLGYQPRRLTGAWEAIAAKQEQATYWDLRKQILLKQFGTAVKGGNAEERESVLQAIKKYNQELPQEARAKGISGQTLRDSVYQRIRTGKLQEAGLPTSKQNFELFRSLDKYFPDGRPTGQVDARPVR